MSDYKVTDTELTSVANAIRTKGGTSAQLEWTSGFVSAIENIQNSYAAGDEGKVVSNGALVAQSSQNIDQDGTYDTTLKNEVVVNVSGGGSPSFIVPKYAEDFDGGYISDGTYYYGQSSSLAMDIWKVKANHKYFIILGIPTGNRFRCMFTTQDITLASGNITGNRVGTDQSPSSNGNYPYGANVSADGRISYTASYDGYLACFKSNNNDKNVPCILIDLTELGS